MGPAPDKDEPDKKRSITIERGTFGATVGAAVVGSLVLGPVCGLIAAGGVAYLATQKKNTPAGETVRKVGDATVDGAVTGAKWIQQQLEEFPKKK